MDTRMIDVVIGVALVFAITSLLATALQELWSSFRSLRGKYMERAVVSFFGDDPVFAKGLLAHPLIVALSKATRAEDRKPSYINADAVISSLIALLCDKHLAGLRPATPAEFVATVTDASQRAGGASSGALPNPAFVDAMRGLAMGVEQDWPAFETRLAAWYDAVGERSIGWFKRHTQVTLFVFGFLVAMVANINPILISARLWQDEALRKATLTVAQEVATNYNQQVSAADKPAVAPPAAPVSAPAAAPAIPAASPPAAAAASKTPGLPAPALARAQASLRPLNAALLKRLADTSDAQLRPSLETLLRAAITLRGALNATPPDAQAIARSSAALEQAFLPGEPHAELRALFEPVQLALVTPTAAATAAPGAASAPVVLARLVKPTGKEIPRQCERFGDDVAAKSYCTRLAELDTLQSIGLPLGWTGSAWPTYFDEACDPAGKAVPCRLGDRIGDGGWWGNLLIALLGWSMTAVACTLGGPFWFDLLNRLVKLRAAGTKAQETPAAANAASAAEPPKSMLARTPTTAAPGATQEAPPEAMSDALNDAERGLSPQEVERVQRGLGLTGAEVTALFDGRTRAAIKTWQGERGQAQTAELTLVQIQELLGLAPGSNDDDYLA